MNSDHRINADTFAQTLRMARERAGLTQRELGLRAGVNFSQVSRYEQGAALPRPGMLIKLAEAVGVSPEYLRAGEEMTQVDLVTPDGDRIPIAFPASYMGFITEAARTAGRTVEEEITAMIMNGVRALEDKLRPLPPDHFLSASDPATRPSKKRK